MILAIDHIQIAARDRVGAARAYQSALGQTPLAAGDTFRFQTENVALHIIAAGQGQDEGLTTVAFAVDDLTSARHQLERRGAPSAMIETDRVASALIGPDASHGVRIVLVETPGPSPVTAPSDAVHALDHIVIRTPNADRAVAFYGARLGLDLRLDRTNPAWNARLLFFRCGDAVVEISAEPDAAPSTDRDRLSGLAWRARDPDAARRRMASAGLDVSEVRPGRKAGTQVFTVRSGLIGAPSLVIASEGSDF